jgi:hypothetical protein
VSNFLRGLVQRGAGLPPTVTILSAGGPQQHHVSIPVSSEVGGRNQKATPISLVTPESSIAPGISDPDFAEPSESTMQPVAMSLHGSTSEIHWPQIRPPAALQPVAAPESGADETRPVRRRIVEDSQSAEPAVTTPIFAVPRQEGLATPSQFFQESSPPPHPPPCGAESLPVRQVAAVGFSPARLVPNLEHFAVLRASQPAASADRATQRRTGPEPHRIQVKIGRVEIRSSQPATVVRTTRPSSPGGFDDCKLARTYLDRSLG